MSGKTQLRLLISVALVFFAIILLYALFFTQPIKLYSIAATEYASEMSREETEQRSAASSISEVSQAESSLRMDLNTATKADLMEVDGIGSVLATRIIQYRDIHGPFQSIEGLRNVEGIGDAKLEALQSILYIP